MSAQKRIKPGKYDFVELFSEVEGLCPLCLNELITAKNGHHSKLAEAAHIYPHSPSQEEIMILKDVPMPYPDSENINNLILLCPSCHTKFDHPRTYEEYMQLYELKQQLIKRKAARKYYSNHSLEDELINLFNCIETLDIENDSRKLSYNVMTVKEKMSHGASNSIIQLVMRNVQDYYLPIKETLIQLEQDYPGKSDLIAKEINLFYSKLKAERLTQDEIYFSINDWLDKQTKQKYKFLTPLITAFYIQNCEVFSL